MVLFSTSDMEVWGGRPRYCPKVVYVLKFSRQFSLAVHLYSFAAVISLRVVMQCYLWGEALHNNSNNIYKEDYVPLMLSLSLCKFQGKGNAPSIEDNCCIHCT